MAPYIKRPRSTVQESRDAFFNAAGITDSTPYENMELGKAIEAIRKAAGITYNDIGPSAATAFNRIQSVRENKSPFGKIERALGDRFNQLLDTAAASGRIDRASGMMNPDFQKQELSNVARRYPKPKPTPQEARDAFFNAAGITDTSPYENMELGEAIEAIRRAAGITLEMIGPTHQAAEQQISRIQDGSSKFGRTERTLGLKFHSLLDKAASTGKIDRSTGVANPDWQEQQKLQQLQESLNAQVIQKENFCAIIGISSQDYAHVTLTDLIKTWHKHAELSLVETKDQSAQVFYHLNHITQHAYLEHF